MLLVFFARMVDDLVASVAASAVERGKAIIGANQPEPPRARVELVPARPEFSNAAWTDGAWQWNGRNWSWQPGQWTEQTASKSARAARKRADVSKLEVPPPSHRPNLTLLTAAGAR